MADYELLIYSPVIDDVTATLHQWSEDLKRELPDRVEIDDYRDQFIIDVEAEKPPKIAIFSHGDVDKILAPPGYIEACKNDDFFYPFQEIYLLACLAGQILAPDIVRKCGSKVIGFVKPVVVYTSPIYERFLMMPARLMAEGYSAREAYVRTVNEAARYLYENWTFILSFLWADIQSMVYYWPDENGEVRAMTWRDALQSAYLEAEAARLQLLVSLLGTSIPIAALPIWVERKWR